MHLNWASGPSASIAFRRVYVSKHSVEAAVEAAHRKFASAYDDPGTPEEISRRSFMANASLVVGGVIGIVLAVPIVGSLIPQSSGSKGNWAPLTKDEFDSLQTATSKPVKLEFTLKGKDSYLPEQSSGEYVWGIKVASADAFMKGRTDIATPTLPYSDGQYDVVNMNFVILSSICPHLGCRPQWNDGANRFQCPCHGSQFGLDGEHLAGPAPRGMDPLPLRQQSGNAEIMWIRYQSGIPNRVIISYQS
jgi:menaquinol-cytochrome c reductase iron-sulfur subunit